MHSCFCPDADYVERVAIHRSRGTYVHVHALRGLSVRASIHMPLSGPATYIATLNSTSSSRKGKVNRPRDLPLRPTCSPPSRLPTSVERRGGTGHSSSQAYARCSSGESGHSARERAGRDTRVSQGQQHRSSQICIPISSHSAKPSVCGPRFTLPDSCLSLLNLPARLPRYTCSNLSVGCCYAEKRRCSGWGGLLVA